MFCLKLLYIFSFLYAHLSIHPWTNVSFVIIFPLSFIFSPDFLNFWSYIPCMVAIFLDFWQWCFSFIFVSKIVCFAVALMLSGTSFQILGPKKEIDSEPEHVEKILLGLKKLLFLVSLSWSFSGNNWVIKSGEKPWYTLYISNASICKFLWWKLTSLFPVIPWKRKFYYR